MKLTIEYMGHRTGQSNELKRVIRITHRPNIAIHTISQFTIESQ